MDLKKENKQLKEYIIVLKNYCNVLKKKNQIQKDSMVRNQKLILKNRIAKPFLRPIPVYCGIAKILFA